MIALNFQFNCGFHVPAGRPVVRRRAPAIVALLLCLSSIISIFIIVPLQPSLCLWCESQQINSFLRSSCPPDKGDRATMTI